MPAKRHAGVSHYLRHDSSITDVPRFESITFPQVASGMDLQLVGRGPNLELRFHLSPGVDPEAQWFSWGRPLCQRGDTLVVPLHRGEIRLAPPRAFQGAELPARYRVRGDSFSVLVAGADPAEPLLIDPVLEYASYLGGGRSDEILALDVDDAGFVIVTGRTSSLNFPTQAPLQSGCGSCGPSSTDAFVTKLTPDGLTVLFSTFLGGSDLDEGLAGPGRSVRGTSTSPG